MDCSKKVRHRLNRSEGQIRGILNMVNDERSCEEVVTQLLAVRSSIDKVIGLIVTENIKQSMNTEEQTNEQLDQALNLIIKTR